MEDYGNNVLDGYSATRILFYIGVGRTDLNGVFRTGTFGHYRVLQIATQGNVSSENTALFLQDSWRPIPNLTLKLGVRMDDMTWKDNDGAERAYWMGLTPGIGEMKAPFLYRKFVLSEAD